MTPQEETTYPRSDEFRALTKAASDAIVIIDEASTIQFVNPAVEEIFGYHPEELIGQPLTTLMSDQLAQQHRDGIQRYLQTGDKQLDWEYIELTGLHKDGHEVPLGVSFGEFEQDGERFFTGIIRDITERKQHEGQLTAINTVSRQLMGAETKEEVSETGVEGAEILLDFSVAALCLYDDTSGELHPIAQTSEAAQLMEGTCLLDQEIEYEWNAFIENEVKVFDELPEQTAQNGGVAIDSGAVFPVGKHGVLVVGSPTEEELTTAVVGLAKILTADIEAALDNAQRQQKLQEREKTLEDQNERLERLNRINDVIRQIDQALVDASTREEIDRAVCHELAEAGPYRFAWIGEYDTVDETITPRERAGNEDGYLDSISLTVDPESPNQAPAKTAVQTRESHVIPDLMGEPPFAPWRQEALNRDYRSSIGLPLVYEDSLYGVLTVYADQSNVFDELERAVLAELSETIAYAFNVLESKKALVSESVVELEFEIRDPDIVALQLVKQTGCRFEFESLIPETTGMPRIFFTARGAPPERIREFIEQSEAVSQIRLITEQDDEVLFECALTDDSFIGTLLDHQAVPRAITAEGEIGNVVIDLPQSRDVRDFSEMFQSKYPDSDLLARRERERSIRTQQGFKAALEERLTDRQQEVLQTAYFSGFFESPRESTGEDIGDTLGVSQPTVNHHLRASQRKFLEMLFGKRKSTSDNLDR